VGWLVGPTLGELETGEEPVETGRAYFLMGQVMVGSGERERGLAKVRAGLGMLPAQGEDVAALRGEIVAWLDRMR
jgi:hypothetical protein